MFDNKSKECFASKGLSFNIVVLKGFGMIRLLFEKPDKIFLEQQNSLMWDIIPQFPFIENGLNETAFFNSDALEL